MTYKMIACALSAPIDIDRIQKTANRYSDHKFFIEIYKNGTCIFPPVSLNGKTEDSVQILVALQGKHLDFTVREMDDHHFVVAYSEFVFSIVFADEFSVCRNEILQQVENITSDEVLIGKTGASSDHQLVGLYARSRLLADIQTPQLIRSIIPSVTSGGN